VTLSIINIALCDTSLLYCATASEKLFYVLRACSTGYRNFRLFYDVFVMHMQQYNYFPVFTINTQ